MASPAVAALLQTFTSDASLFSGEASIYGLPSPLSPSTTFTQPCIASLSDPFLIFANVGYKAGQTALAVPGWKALVASAEEKESGTLSYTVLADTEKEWIRTVEAYESKEFFDSVHVKSEAVEAIQRQDAEKRTGEKEVHRLRVVAGYLYKEEAARS